MNDAQYINKTTAESVHAHLYKLKMSLRTKTSTELQQGLCCFIEKLYEDLVKLGETEQTKSLLISVENITNTLNTRKSTRN